MKLYLKYLLLIFLNFNFSCKYVEKDSKIEKKFFNLKNELLYKDAYSNIYLKMAVDIKNQNPKKCYKVIHYFDDISYNDSVLKLKDIIDIASFKYNKTINDTLCKNYSDYFVDDKYIYRFQYLPPCYPQIRVTKKKNI